MKISSKEDVRTLYEETAHSYNSMMDGEIELPVYSDTLSRLAERIIDIPGPVIDTACGTGHMLHLYHERYDPQRALVGIDLSPSMIDMTCAKLDSGAETFVGDMRELTEISSASAAAIINFFAIHHLNPQDILTAFKEWYRALRPQGQLVLAVWEGSGVIDYGDETDVVAWRYSENELSAWLVESGFVVTRCRVEAVEEIPMQAIYLEAGKK